MTLLEALGKLDPKNDTHWTTTGAPVMVKVQELMGDETITRKMIADAAPGFDRDHPLKTEEEVPNGDESQEDTAEAEANEEVTAEAEEAEDEEASNISIDPDIDDFDEATAMTEEEALAMPMTEIRYDMEALTLATNALTRELNELGKAKAALDKKLDKISRHCDTLTNYMEVLKKADPAAAQRDIMTYIRRQNQVRATKAQAAQRVLTEGTTMQDIARAMNPRAPLDQAMMSRKQARGAQRPIRSVIQ